MKKKILVANRGEIAIRIIRATQELGLCAVAIYETPDTDALHVRIADEAIWLGDGPRSDYLNIDKVIKAARKAGADDFAVKTADLSHVLKSVENILDNN